MNNERLDAILAHCRACLALSEKRTQGKWETDVKARHPAIFTEEGDFIGVDLEKHNASFIAACAGAAEAGWRSTIAAINLLAKMRRYYGPSNKVLYSLLDEREELIIKAWDGIV